MRIIYNVIVKKQKKGHEKMRKIAKSLVAVYTHAHTSNLLIKIKRMNI